jgi:DegV family protein with EDD domain
MVGAEEFGGRITVVDSGQVSLGLGFQAVAAAETAAGGADLEQTLAAITDTRARVRVFAMLDTLTQLKRSGRVSWAKASVGEILKVKLFIEVKDGEILSVGQTRTRKKGIAQLGQILKDLGRLERLAMLHTNAEEEARALLEDVSPVVATPPIFRNITTVVGTHVGVKALGIAAVTEKRKY